MITITSKSRYAVAALCELAKRGGSKPVPIGDLAASRQIPVQFLEQLFSTLRRAGILKSQRGVKGGYTFARGPDDVTILDVVEALDGDVCTGSSDAAEVFKEASASLRDVLGAKTIADVVESESAAGAQMYYI